MWERYRCFLPRPSIPALWKTVSRLLLWSYLHSVVVNHYKCGVCEMTCTTPSSLRQHERSRHNINRPYSCTMCDARYVGPGIFRVKIWLILVIFWHFLQNMEFLHFSVTCSNTWLKICNFHGIFEESWKRVENSAKRAKIWCYFLAVNSANSVLRDSNLH